MNSITDEVQQNLLDFLDSQRVAVLSTIGPKDPYSCLMSFEVSRDLKYISFSTKRTRRKYRNILHNARVSLVIDNRNNENFELMATKVVTIIGSAQDYQGSDRGDYILALQKKHPYLHDFFEEDDTALLLLKIDFLYIVDNFERVQSYDL